jgi:hypothetical protein
MSYRICAMLGCCVKCIKFRSGNIKKCRLEYLGTDGQKMLKYVLEIRPENVNRIHFFQGGNNWGKGVGGSCG